MRVGAALAFTVIAGCMSSAGGGGGNSGPSTLSVAITSGTCPNGVLTVKGTATGSQGTAFFVDDGITDLANSVCAPWYTIQGGCNRGDSGSDTTMWTATQAEDLSTGPRTFTVTVKKVIDDVNSGIVQTKVTCGGSGGAGGGGGGGGGGIVHASERDPMVLRRPQRLPHLQRLQRPMRRDVPDAMPRRRVLLLWLLDRPVRSSRLVRPRRNDRVLGRAVPRQRRPPAR